MPYILNNKIYLGIAIISLFAISFGVASAHIGAPTGALVPCGTTDNPCNVCHLYTLAHNIIDFLLWVVATPILTIALLVAGFFWLTSAGSPERISKGKSILSSAVFGFIVAFGAWLIINTIMDTLAFKNPFNGSAWTDTSFCSEAPFTPGQVGTTTQPPVTQPPITQPPAGTLSDADARAQLAAAGITVNATEPQTSLNGIQAEAIQDAINIKNACKCNVIVTGGTEGGHSTSGTCTHSSGCKLDLGLNPTLDSYIQTNYTFIGIRSDGAAQYKAPDGTIFAKESNHWDMSAH